MPTISPSNRDDPLSLLLDYLDAYRATFTAVLVKLDETELRRSRVPSGWSPLELLVHVTYMERRWIQWGFAARDVLEPWGDNRDADPDARWCAPTDATLEDLLHRLDEVGAETRRVLAGGNLVATAGVGGRFETSGEAPTLVAILLHVLQEYARHAGHLDVVVELASDGRVLES